MLAVGDNAPWFIGGTSKTPNFRFDALGGCWSVLLFLPTIGGPDDPGRRALTAIEAIRHRFDGRLTHFFGVIRDPEAASRPEHRAGWLHGRLFWDLQGVITRGWQVPEAAAGESALVAYVVSPRLAVHAVLADRDPAVLVARIGAVLDARQPEADGFAIAAQAPVLLRPGLFEPDLCRRLIAYHAANDPEVGMVMINDPDGNTRRVVDRNQKVRRDLLVEDPDLRGEIRDRIGGRLVPEIRRAFQFQVSQIERYLIGCYDEADGGHFEAHRDNTTRGTSHRKFALTVNLNDDYDGGELCFPEHGAALYKPPVGGGVVFSCSLMHKAMPVTRGCRYVFVPFLHDQASAQTMAAGGGGATAGSGRD